MSLDFFSGNGIGNRAKVGPVSLLILVSPSFSLFVLLWSGIDAFWELLTTKLPLGTFPVKSITAGVLSAISDIASQKLSGVQKLQIRRLLLKVLFGCAYLGPFGHFFHMMLDKIFKGKKDPKTVAKKVVFEQLTISPLNNMLFMIYFGGIIEGRPWTHVRSKIKTDYPSLQLTAWMIGPVFAWINHQYVPLQLRVVYGSLVSFCWGIFLNLRARSMVPIKP